MPICPKEPKKQAKIKYTKNLKGIIIIIGVLISGIAFTKTIDTTLTGPDKKNQILPKIEWQKELNLGLGNDGSSTSYIQTLITSDGHIVVVGEYNGIFFSKFDLNGSMIWLKFIDKVNTNQTDLGPNWANKIEELSDGGFIILIGDDHKSYPGLDTFLVYRTDSEGNVLWYKNFFPEKKK